MTTMLGFEGLGVSAACSAASGASSNATTRNHECTFLSANLIFNILLRECSITTESPVGSLLVAFRVALLIRATWPPVFILHA